MAVPDYRLGTSVASLLPLPQLGLPLPRAEVVDYAAYVDAGDGERVGHGWLRCAWRFDGLDVTEIAILRTFCPGVTAWVYISTLTEGGTYAVYAARMVWPGRKAPKDDTTFDFVLEFRELVAQ